MFRWLGTLELFMGEDQSRVRVATTRTLAKEGRSHGGAAVHLLNAQSTINDEEDDRLSHADWRQLFVDFPQLEGLRESQQAGVVQLVTHRVPSRVLFPRVIPWVDLSCGDVVPARWTPSLVALRGTITRFEIDTATGEEEVDLMIEIFPAHSDLIKLVRTGPIADTLFTACMRAVNLFPRGRVENGASFTAYLSMGYQCEPAHEGVQEKFRLAKLVWDLTIQSGPQTTARSLRTRLQQALGRAPASTTNVWAPSDPQSEIYSGVEAALVMDLHSVLFRLWQEGFGSSDGLVQQLRDVARVVQISSPVRAAYGKSSLRRWSGPDLFERAL